MTEKMICKCGSPMHRIIRLEIDEIQHVKKFFLCDDQNCSEMQVIYSDRRDATIEEIEWVTKIRGGLY